jgi:Tol biopolymer transport system component
MGLPVGLLDQTMIYLRADGVLMALPVDIARRRATGAPVLLLNGTPVLSAAVSANGTLVYIRRSTVNRALVVELSGKATALIAEPLDMLFPVVSRSGLQVAFSTSPATGRHIAIYDIPSKTIRQLTSVVSERPAWSGDGSRIGFTGFVRAAGAGATGRASDAPQAFWMAVNGNKNIDTLAFPIATDDAGLREVTFSPDGRFAVLRNDGRNSKRDLWLLTLGTAGPLGKPVPLEVTPADELMPRVSPDSRHLVWISDVSGTHEVYVRPFPGSGPTLKVSERGGTEPVWAPDGRGIYYRSHGKFMLASLAGGTVLRVTGRRELFDDRYLSDAVHQQYDAMPDGRTLLTLEPIPSGEQEGQAVFVVSGWQRELREQLTARKGAKR